MVSDSLISRNIFAMMVSDSLISRNIFTITISIISYLKIRILLFLHLTPLRRNFFPTSHPITENEFGHTDREDTKEEIQTPPPSYFEKLPTVLIGHTAFDLPRCKQPFEPLNIQKTIWGRMGDKTSNFLEFTRSVPEFTCMSCTPST